MYLCSNWVRTRAARVISVIRSGSAVMCWNVQAVTRPDGLPLWTSPAEPGSVHDLFHTGIPDIPGHEPPQSERFC